MKVLLIDNETTLLEKLKNLIPNKEDVIRFDVFKKEDIDYYDLVILSGSSLMSLEGNEENFSEEIDFIKNTKKPIIGICFGCELIAKAFGGRLKKLDVKQKGIKEITISMRESRSSSSIKVYENHRWVIDYLPDCFDVLARSGSGPEIIKHKMLPIYGFQFHPENFTEELEGDEVFMKLFCNLLGS